MASVDGQPEGPGVSVERLLAEDLFRDALVAGAAGVCRSVTWCVPLLDDVGPDLPGARGDMGGMAVYIPARRLSDGSAPGLVQWLSAQGAQLLLTTTPAGGHARTLDQAIAAADQLKLPLLLLPPRTPFRDASRLIGVKVLAQTTHVLEYGTRVHRALGEVFARGAGLGALAESMSRLSGTTVLIMGNSGDLLAEAQADPKAPDVSAAAVERVLELVTSGDYKEDTEGADGLAKVVTLDVDRDVLHGVLAPIRVAGDPYGTLILIEPTYPAPEHDLSRHVVVAEQGVSLAGSELLRQHSVREAEERARNDFVHALLHGRFTDHLELAARASHYRFPVDGRFAVFIMTAGGLHPDHDEGRRKIRGAERVARSVASDQDTTALTALIGSMVVIVREVVALDAAGSNPLDEPRQLKTFAVQLQRAARQKLRTDVRVAYGRPFDGAAGVAKSYREARTTEALARRVHTEEVCSYADLRVFAALQESALSEAGQSFAAEILAPLKRLDGQTGNLEALVLAYIEEAGNLNATARRLHLHRNTMLYKLDRASRAMQMDIRTPEAQFMIWLAYHITALSEVVVALEDELAPPT